MGSPCELLFHPNGAVDLNRAIAACREEIARFEEKYSRYLPDSLTSRINNAADGQPVPIDNETFALLNYADVCYQQSDGLFDLTSGALRKIWHKQQAQLPSQTEIDDCLALIGWEKVEYDSHSVRLPLAGMQLDFGGVVKEYVADACATVASQHGITHGVINLGGDITILGGSPDGSPLPVGITHPLETESAIALIHIQAGAVTTSGHYERYAEIDGRRYSHLVNPKTGWPVEGLLSATVVADKAVLAGSITSIAMLKDEASALAWLESCELPYLAVDKELGCHGHLAA